MNRSRSIQIKAVFLVLVFSIHTVIGVACALGIDFDCNMQTHQEEMAMATSAGHSCGSARMHHEEAGKNKAHKSTDNGDDNCCSKHAVLSKVDKSVPQSAGVPLPMFFTTFVAAFYNVNIASLFQNTPNIKYFVRSHHPPIPDIRIAIQSFQI